MAAERPARPAPIMIICMVGVDSVKCNVRVANIFK